MPTLAEKEAAFKKVNNAMKPHTGRFVAAIYGCISRDDGELLGSGTFLEVGGTTYLLTAAHVAEEGLKRYWKMACSTGNGLPPQILENPIICRGFPSDLAITRVEPPPPTAPGRGNPHGPQAPSLVGIDVLPSGRFASELGTAETDVLYVHGFPGKYSRFLRLGNGVFSDSFPYGTCLGSSNYSWFNPSVHFAVEYPASGQQDEFGKPATLPDPHGLSGSALWKTNLNSVPVAAWSTDTARVIGVVTTWDMDAQSLVVTRIEAVREFVLWAVRQERAYFNWLGRGQPNGDDWVDWFAARNQLPDL